MNAYRAEQFKKELINVINNSGCTLPTTFYIVKEIFIDFEKQYIEASLEKPEDEEEQNIEINIDEDKNKNVKDTLE